jgi:hypothetical protein
MVNSLSNRRTLGPGCYDCETNELVRGRFRAWNACRIETLFARTEAMENMMTRTKPAMIAMLLLSACNVSQTNDTNTAEALPGSAGDNGLLPIANDAAPAPAGTGETPAAPSEANPAPPGTPGGLPDDRTPLEEPKGPVDPKSAEGAGQVVQRYGGLLEQRQFADARRLWGDGGKASGLSEAQFIAAYDKYATIHSEVGKPTGMEGAAGSSYITVPFHLYGTLKSGAAFNMVGPLTLRRINDVPGSTEAQRRWHIVESGLKPRP